MTSQHGSGRHTAAAVVAALAMAVAGIATAGAEAAPSATIVLDSNFETSTDPWIVAGAVMAQSTTDGHDSSSSLAVTQRSANWAGPRVANLLQAGTTYTLSAWVKLAPGVAGTSQLKFTIESLGAGAAANSYTQFNTPVAVTADDWVQISATTAVPADHTNIVLYLEASDIGAEHPSFSVDDVLITTEDAGPQPGQPTITTGFEDGLDPWVPRQGGPDSAASLELVTSGAHAGTQAACVTGRTNTGDGIGLDVTDRLTAGTTYQISAWVRFADQAATDTVVVTAQTGDSTFTTLLEYTGATNTGWTELTGTFTMPGPFTAALLYIETKWESNNPTRNTSTFCVDDITIGAPEASQEPDLSLEPLADTVDFRLGAAVSPGQLAGAPADLLLHHFNQITPENAMKPEAWYDADRNLVVSPVALQTMQFAQDHSLPLYGHTLMWYEGQQMPPWFFDNADGDPLTNSAADQAILTQRIEDHIDFVAQSLAEAFGPFGSATNPLVAFDVVNEALAEGPSPDTGGLRNSRLYQVLGEQFLDIAFAAADQAFNHTYVAPGADSPVTLFLNDYNTENPGKAQNMHDVAARLLQRGVPITGLGHQLHLSLTTGTSMTAINHTLDLMGDLGLVQAVTELDVTTGLPVTEAALIEQGYYYRALFDTLRAFNTTHPGQLFSVTLWGLDDGQSWRGTQAPLVFDAALQAKPAYQGIVGGQLPAPTMAANSFAAGDSTADISPTPAGVASPEWAKLPAQPIGYQGQAGFSTRWSPDTLTVYVAVADPQASADDAVTIQIDDQQWVITRAGAAEVPAAVVTTAQGYALVAALPLVGAAEGTSLDFDVRVAGAGDQPLGWNSPGTLGTLSLIEPLSFVTIPAAQVAPTIDGQPDDLAWADAPVVHTAVRSPQSTTDDPAQAEVRLVWADDTLYVLAEVSDPTYDVSSANAYEQDSVEIYLDRANLKNGPYTATDTQMRISREGGLSFGDRGATPDAATQASWLQVATDPETPGGYLVEAAISLQGAGGPATYQGLDLQVNDGANGARVALYNWADPTDNGYQSTAHWGVALLAPAPVPPPPPPAELSPTLSTVVRGQDDSPTVGQARLADGQDAQTILVTLRDSDGAPLEGLADQIDVVADRAGLVWDQAEDRGDGVYSLRLLADTAGRWQVSVLVGQVALADTASVNFLAASLSDSSVEPGQRVTATGSGFLPGESVRAQLGTTDLGSVLADLVSGTATVAFSVPTGLAAGTHTLTLTGATSGTVTVSFTVARVPDEPTPPTPQAPTGGWADPASGSTVPLALLGLLLVAGGIRLLRRVGLTS